MPDDLRSVAMTMYCNHVHVHHNYCFSLSYESIIKCVVYCMMFGLPSLLFAHILSIHAWPNFTGELTRFADRKFYSVS